MSHSYTPLFPGASKSLPCAICGRRGGSHDQTPIAPGTRLDHNELIRRLGRCDGRCGGHTGAPFGHNDLLRLYGRCDGSCGQHRA